MEGTIGDFSAYGSLELAPPGVKDTFYPMVGLTTGRPRDWYDSYSRVFAEDENHMIFPDRTSVGVLNADMMSLINVAFAVEQRAFAIHRDMDNMDANDTMVSTALNVLISGALGVQHGGAVANGKPFSVECDEFPVAADIIDALCKRADVYTNLWDMGRNSLKYGNEFREVVLDDEYQTPIQREQFPNIRGCIVRFDHRPENQMWPHFDKKGNRIPGYAQKGRYQFRQEDLEYAEWQVVHFKFGGLSSVSWGKGTPLFYSCRRAWKKLQYLEEGLILARISRAYPKYLHKIAVPISMATDKEGTDLLIDAYIDKITHKRELNVSTGNVETQFNPTDVTSDFIVPRYFYAQAEASPVESDVTVLEASNVQLTSLQDVEYLQNKVLTASCVPRRYLGLEDKQKNVVTDKSGTGQEEVQFAQMLMKMQSTLEDGLRKLFDMELRLHGIDPEQIEYHIRWPEIATIDPMSQAQLSLTKAQAAKAWQEVFQGGLSTSLIVRKFLAEPHEDADALAAEIEESVNKAKEEAQRAEMEAAAAWNAPGAAEERGIYDGSEAPKEAQGQTPDEGVQGSSMPGGMRSQSRNGRRPARLLNQVKDDPVILS